MARDPPDSYQEVNNFCRHGLKTPGHPHAAPCCWAARVFAAAWICTSSYHDGQAVTCDRVRPSAWPKPMAPISASSRAGMARLARPGCGPRVTSMWPTAATPDPHATRRPHGQPRSEALHIPVALGLIGPDGEDLPLRLEGEGRARAPPRCSSSRASRRASVSSGCRASRCPRCCVVFGAGHSRCRRGRGPSGLSHGP